MGDGLRFIVPIKPAKVANPPATGEWSTEVTFDDWRVQLVVASFSWVI